MADVLRTIYLAGHPFRIYASPLDVPDHPWASFEDLMSLAEMDDVDQAEWRTKVRQDLPDMLHDLKTGMTLVAEPLVGGFFMAWVMMGAEQAQVVLDDWTEAWTELFVAQNAHLPREQWMQVVQEAELRNASYLPGMTVMQ